MWRIINFGCAEREGGVRVSLVGFRTLTYEREGALMKIDVEPGDPKLAVYAHSVGQWEKPQQRVVDEDERRAILDDVGSALRALKVPYEVIGD